MSKATKLKYIAKEFDDLSVPNESQRIVRILGSPGNNLYEVVDSTGDQYLVSLPMKFRKNIWTKRGDFVLVEPIPEGKKVKAEIVKVLTKEHKKWYRAQKCWPKEFDDTSNQETTENKRREDDKEEDDLFVNTNRLEYCNRTCNESDTSSDESDSD